jgi:hypothetical protein
MLGYSLRCAWWGHMYITRMNSEKVLFNRYIAQMFWRPFYRMILEREKEEGQSHQLWSQVDLCWNPSSAFKSCTTLNEWLLSLCAGFLTYKKWDNKCVNHFVLVGMEFELRASHLQSRHTTAWAIPFVHFCSGYFGNRISQTIFPGWPWTTILPIYQVARITRMSRGHLAKCMHHKRSRWRLNEINPVWQAACRWRLSEINPVWQAACRMTSNDTHLPRLIPLCHPCPLNGILMYV